MINAPPPPCAPTMPDAADSRAVDFKRVMLSPNRVQNCRIRFQSDSSAILMKRIVTCDAHVTERQTSH